MVETQNLQGRVLDFDFSATKRGKWSLINHDSSTSWIHVSYLDKSEDQSLKVFMTSDMELVKELLERNEHDIEIKSFQIMFPSKFPDNPGWGIAEIYELTEEKTKKNVVFHKFYTHYGFQRIGGPARLSDADVRHSEQIILYYVAAPKHPRRYYPDR
jgi:hypothetical protein